MLPAASQYTALIGAAIGCSAVAVAVAQRLSRGYIHTLERSLLDRAVELELSDVGDITTRTVMMRTIRAPRPNLPRPNADTRQQNDTRSQGGDTTARIPVPANDPELREIVALRSRNRDAVLQVLRADEGLPAGLIPHVIPLLAWDPVAEDAVRALRKVAEERVGELVDALLDPNQPFASRRRLARVFSVCVSQRAVDGVLLGLEDLRFEVRFQCGRSLASIVEKNPRIRIDKERVFDVVRREVAVGRPVWESHRLLDTVDADARIVRGRVPEGPRRAESGSCLHAALARTPHGSAADRVSRPSYRRPGIARNGTRVPRRCPASRHPRSPVAVPERPPTEAE
jgi:hypothetical protein